MTKYFVYHVKTANKDESVNAFVEDVRSFATFKFDPLTMKFSGICIEADSIEDAHGAFLCPQEDDDVEIISCDEPQETEQRRLESGAHKVRLDELQQRIKNAEKIVKSLYVKKVAEDLIRTLHSFTTKTSMLARAIHASSDDQSVLVEKLYERLLEKFIEQLRQQPYEPKKDDGETAGS